MVRVQPGFPGTLQIALASSAGSESSRESRGRQGDVWALSCERLQCCLTGIFFFLHFLAHDLVYVYIYISISESLYIYIYIFAANNDLSFQVRWPMLTKMVGSFS